MDTRDRGEDPLCSLRLLEVVPEVKNESPKEQQKFVKMWGIRPAKTSFLGELWSLSVYRESCVFVNQTRFGGAFPCLGSLLVASVQDVHLWRFEGLFFPPGGFGWGLRLLGFSPRGPTG